MTPKALKYGYLGSGRFAARCLEILSGLSGWSPPSFIVTAPAKASGRGNKLTPTPVRAFADDSPLLEGVPVVESANASGDDAVLKMLAESKVDFCFVVDFGQIIREPLLQWEAHVGCLNIHPSLLPHYRGAAPVQRALMACEGETGVTIFKLASGMDSGPVLLQRKVAIEESDDSASILERAAIVGVDAFVNHASRVPIDEWIFTPQDDSLATCAPKISRDEERIDWGRSARDVIGTIKGLSPKPGAWTTFRDKRLRILAASLSTADCNGEPGKLTFTGNEIIVSCGNGCVSLSSVQAEGKKIQSAAEWKNGLRAAGEECLI